MAVIKGHAWVAYEWKKKRKGGKEDNYPVRGLFAAQLERTVYYEVIISNACKSLQ